MAEGDHDFGRQLSQARNAHEPRKVKGAGYFDSSDLLNSSQLDNNISSLLSWNLEGVEYVLRALFPQNTAAPFLSIKDVSLS